MEFLILIGFSTLALAVFYIVGIDQFQTASSERKQEALWDLGNAIQMELITASEVHNGYNRSLQLPLNLDGSDYTLTLQQAQAYTVVTISAGNQRYSVQTPVCTGSLQPGRNTITKMNGTLRCNS
jgi:hypothetical protein